MTLRQVRKIVEHRAFKVEFIIIIDSYYRACCQMSHTSRDPYYTRTVVIFRRKIALPIIHSLLLAIESNSSGRKG